MKWILLLFGALAFIAAGLYGVGIALPHAHVARMEGLVAKTPAEIAAIIRDVRSYPKWRGVVVENVVETAEGVSYVELAEGDRIAYLLTEPERDAKFVATITDPSLPFGGAWTIALIAEGAATRVRIQEDGDVRDPLYRFFAHFVFGYTSSMKTYLKGLGATDIREPDAGG